MFRTLNSSSKCIIGCGLALAMLVSPGTARAQSKYKVLYSFGAYYGDGSLPYAGLIADSAGNLYGTTWMGDADSWGTVFKLTAKGKETLLYSFTGGSDGGQPYAGLLADSSGNLYGTTYTGGIVYCGYGTAGCGTVFKVAPDGTETVLYSFCSKGNCTDNTQNDGTQPEAGLIADSAGNLYGTTPYGGKGCYGLGCGTVFKLRPPALGKKKWTETVLHTFTGGSDGAGPFAGVIVDSSGNLYGTTWRGGTNDDGTVFKVAPDGTETVLYSFCSQANCTDGGVPFAGLHADSSGNLYGTTYSGGTNDDGTVFRLAPDGTETVLHSFAGGSDGAGPHAGLIGDSSGNLYGTTVNGGAEYSGTAFRVAPDGTETVLHSFFCSLANNCTDGALPYAGLIADSSGDLYGTTWLGGLSNAACDQYLKGCGVVFELKK